MLFTTTRRVEFADTDMAGIMHFTAYFRFMEEAEHELLRSQGLSVVTPEDAAHISWPRVSAACDFLGPACFEDELTILVSVESLKSKSVTYRFEVFHEARKLAEGRMTSVCCRITAGAPPQAIEIPPPIREKLERLMGEKRK